MNRDPESSPLGFRVIGAFKLASALLLVAAGFGLLRLLNADLGATLEQFVTRLHLDPENRLVHEAASRLSGISPSQLKALSAGTFFYAILHLIEGSGLLLRRHWAGYLTIIATGSLLPLEVYEITRKLSVVRVGVLAVNLGIVIYLIVKLLQERRDRANSAPRPADRPRSTGR